MSTENAKAQERTRGQITDEALGKLRARIGKEHKIEHPFTRSVNRDSIAHSAEAVGDDNPLYIDPEYARQSPHGRLLAPPVLLYGASWGAWDARRGEGLPGVHALHAGDNWSYHEPLGDGDTLRSTVEMTGAEELTGRWTGRMILQTRRFRFYNQNDALVATCDMSLMRGEARKRAAEAKPEARPKLEPPKYSAGDIAGIYDEILAQKPRGAEPLYWEDVEVGHSLGMLTRGPLGQQDMMAWRMAMGGGYLRSGRYWAELVRRSPASAPVDPATGIPEPVARVHWDIDTARRVGIPAPYDFGTQRGGFCTTLFTNWMGDPGWLAALNLRYSGLCFVGDTMRYTGTVVEKWRDAGGNGLVLCRVEARTQRDILILKAVGVVALPQRGAPKVSFPVRLPAEFLAKVAEGVG